jgi:hypothetical protein
MDRKDFFITYDCIGYILCQCFISYIPIRRGTGPIKSNNKLLDKNLKKNNFCKVVLEIILTLGSSSYTIVLCIQ